MCDECGEPLDICCDGIKRCLECSPCPSCYDGGMCDEELIASLFEDDED